MATVQPVVASPGARVIDLNKENAPNRLARALEGPPIKIVAGLQGSPMPQRKATPRKSKLSHAAPIPFSPIGRGRLVPVRVKSRAPQSATGCQKCAKMEPLLKRANARAINAEEDVKQYQAEFQKIQAEGMQLYAEYEIKCKKIKEAEPFLAKMESDLKSKKASIHTLKQTLKKQKESYEEEKEKIEQKLRSLTNERDQWMTMHSKLGKENKSLQAKIDAVGGMAIRHAISTEAMATQTGASPTRGWLPHPVENDEEDNNKIVEGLEAALCMRNALIDDLKSQLEAALHTDSETCPECRERVSQEQQVEEWKAKAEEAMAQLEQREMGATEVSNELLRAKAHELEAQVNELQQDKQCQDALIKQLESKLTTQEKEWQITQQALKKAEEELHAHQKQVEEWKHTQTEMESAHQVTVSSLEQQLVEEQTLHTTLKEEHAAMSSTIQGMKEQVVTLEASTQALEEAMNTERSTNAGLKEDLQSLYTQHKKTIQDLSAQYAREDYQGRYHRSVAARDRAVALLQSTRKMAQEAVTVGVAQKKAAQAALANVQALEQRAKALESAQVVSAKDVIRAQEQAHELEESLKKAQEEIHNLQQQAETSEFAVVESTTMAEEHAQRADEAAKQAEQSAMEAIEARAAADVAEAEVEDARHQVEMLQQKAALTMRQVVMDHAADELAWKAMMDALEETSKERIAKLHYQLALSQSAAQESSQAAQQAFEWIQQAQQVAKEEQEEKSRLEEEWMDKLSSVEETLATTQSQLECSRNELGQAHAVAHEAQERAEKLAKEATTTALALNEVQHHMREQESLQEQFKASQATAKEAKMECNVLRTQGKAARSAVTAVRKSLAAVREEKQALEERAIVAEQRLQQVEQTLQICQQQLREMEHQVSTTYEEQTKAFMGQKEMEKSLQSAEEQLRQTHSARQAAEHQVKQLRQEIVGWEERAQAAQAAANTEVQWLRSQLHTEKERSAKLPAAQIAAKVAKEAHQSAVQELDATKEQLCSVETQLQQVKLAHRLAENDKKEVELQMEILLLEGQQQSEKGTSSELRRLRVKKFGVERELSALRIKMKASEAEVMRLTEEMTRLKAYFESYRSTFDGKLKMLTTNLGLAESEVETLDTLMAHVRDSLTTIQTLESDAQHTQLQQLLMDIDGPRGV